MGLVDQFGGLDTAIAWAAEQAGLAEGEWEERALTTPPDPFKAMLAGILTGQSAHARAEAPVLSSVSTLIAGQEQTTMARMAADLGRLMASPGAQALCLPCTGDASPPRTLRQDGQAWWQAAAARLFAN